jgi:hypothetical protein
MAILAVGAHAKRGGKNWDGFCPGGEDIQNRAERRRQIDGLKAFSRVFCKVKKRLICKMLFHARN